MTNSIGDIVGNDVLFIIGSNATEAHPIIGNKMKQAHLRGAKLIVVDPRRTELAEHAHLWLQLRPGTDNALVNGMMHTIISNGWHDKEFIETRTEGFDALWETVKDYPAEVASEICGVPAETIVEAARLYATTRKAGIFYTLGITEHTAGTANVMNLANLACSPGTSASPTPASTPCAARTTCRAPATWARCPTRSRATRACSTTRPREKFEKAWGVRMPEDMGLRIPEMIEPPCTATLKAMYIMGEDPVLTDADANHVRKALESLDFLVVQDIFMTETAKYADVVLPAASTPRRTAPSPTPSAACSGCARPWSRPARRGPTGRSSGTSAPAWATRGTTTRRRTSSRRSARLVPQLRRHHLRPARHVGLQWPCPTKDHPGTPYLHEDRFTRGRGLLQGIQYQAPAELTDEEYPILLTTGRMLYHYNISTRISQILESLRRTSWPRSTRRTPPPWESPTGDEMRVSSRRGLGSHGVTGDRPGAAGDHVHDLPLLGDARERAHQFRLRPDLEDGGVQGLRREDREGAGRHGVARGGGEVE